MAIFPTTLPLPNYDGYTLDPEDNIVRTQMESGLARVRRRSRARRRKLKLTWEFTDAEFYVFEQWVDSPFGTNGGVEWFTIDVAMGDGLKNYECRFQAQPPWSATLQEGMYWTVTATLELRPELIDYALPAVSIANWSVGADAGIAMIPVTRSKDSVQTMSVQYTTVAGTATAGNDYITTTGTLEWLLGEPATKYIPVSVLAGFNGESAETFTVTLSNPVGCTVATGTSTVSIAGTGGATGATVSSISAADATEGQSAIFTINLASVTNTPSTLMFSLGGDVAEVGTPTASAGVTVTGATLNVPSGASVFTVSVPVTADNKIEDDKTLSLTIGAINASATISDNSFTLVVGANPYLTLNQSPLIVPENTHPTIAYPIQFGTNDVIIFENNSTLTQT